MTKESENKVLNYFNMLKNSVQNPKYLTFLNALTTEEMEAYFYIDAHRMNEFIKGFSLDKNCPVGISDLKKQDNINKIKKSIVKSEFALESLINFWDTFGNLKSPGLAFRQNVINKYNEYFGVLTDEEHDFFLNC